MYIMYLKIIVCIQILQVLLERHVGWNLRKIPSRLDGVNQDMTVALPYKATMLRREWLGKVNGARLITLTLGMSLIAA